MLELLLKNPLSNGARRALDIELAEEARSAGCPRCGGALHSANYSRLPRGGSGQLEVRFSFCCAVDGCRRRVTPPSFRFLGRKGYFSAIVVLMAALQHGLTSHRREELRTLVGVSKSTLRRWRLWWVREFAGSDFWKASRAGFSPPPERNSLPASLFVEFRGDLSGRLDYTLRFLLPVSGGRGVGVSIAQFI